MLGRGLAAVTAALLVLAPVAAATHGGSSHGVGCGDGVHEGVGDGENRIAYVRAEPGNGCGIGYDDGGTLDPGDDELLLTLTFDNASAYARYPVLGLDTIPRPIQGPVNMGGSGTGHGGGDTYQAVSAFVATLAGEDTRTTVWMDQQGVHVATPQGTQSFAWPEDEDGDPIVTHERIAPPSDESSSSDDAMADLFDKLRSLPGAGAVPWDTAEDELTSLLPDIIVTYRVEDVGLGGLDLQTTARSAANPTEIAPSAHGRTGTSDPVPQDDPSVASSEVTVESLGAGLTRTIVGLPGGEALIAAAAVASLLTVLGGAALYRRLKEGKVLENSIRHRIFEEIKDRPGITVQELSELLEVDYSTARHHASVLKEFDLILSRRQGRITHYFENHGTFDAFEKDAIPLLREGTSAEIARVVHRNPGIKPAAVARELDLDPSTVKWHLDKLRDADLVDAEPLDGRSLGLVVPEAARELVTRWA